MAIASTYAAAAPAATAEAAPQTAGLPQPAETPVAATPVAVPEVAAAVDPEFLQLFVEEVRENILILRELFPQWEQNPLDMGALRDLRRVFHTLKGSSRMVGLADFGEAAWAGEQLYNARLAEAPRADAALLRRKALTPGLHRRRAA